MPTRLWTHSYFTYTGKGVAAKRGRRIKDADLDILPDGAVVENEGRVLWCGKTKDLPAKFLPSKFSKSNRTDLQGQKSLMPGMVDCHTHLVFSGDRATEFALRCGGKTYEEIAREGGGIQTTVNATRKATLKELVEQGNLRIREMIDRGVRAIEVKSGYGLSEKDELKILEAIKLLKKRNKGIVIHATYMGAHAIPKAVSKEKYLKEMLESTLLKVVKGKLADSCDVFTEVGYFSIEESEALLRKAKQLGLHTRVHADELNNLEASQMAVRIGALSADHLLKVSEKGIQSLAKSNTVAVLLPGTAFFLKAPYAPARKLIDAGAAVALATDFNPGTCMTTSLPLMMTLAALYMEMSMAEIFAAVTYNGAKAIGSEGQLGIIEAGKKCFPIATNFKTFEETYYRFGW